MVEFSFIKEFDEGDVHLGALASGADPADAATERPGLTVIGAWAFEGALGVLAMANAAQEGATVGEVALRRHGPIPPRGQLHGHATLLGTWDLGPMALLRVHVGFSTPSGAPVAEATLGFYLHGRGGFGGERPPRSPRSPLPDRQPDRTLPVNILGDAAERYSLLGDRNPIHLHPDAAAAWPALTQGRPILHGLGGVALVERALANAEAAPIASLRCRLSRPIWPGAALTLETWRNGAARQLRLRRGEEDVWSDAGAEIGAD